MIIKYWFVTLSLLICSKDIFAQDGDQSFSILFYNVENLFDPYDDTLTEDDEFTAQGMRHWTSEKFIYKLNRLYKVLAVSGEWEPPDMIAMAEIENRWILEKLAKETPLMKYGYRVIHRDSPDRRGIDLAVLYRENSFDVLDDTFITVKLTENPAEYSRDIIYIKGVIHGFDTIHFFINHWPSRYRGQINSEWKRIRAAGILSEKVSEILARGQGSGLIVLGDFNDEQADNSLATHLGTRMPDTDTLENALYNLAPSKEGLRNGTHKFQGRWYLFDQFIVTGKVLRSACSCTFSILDFDFLLEEDVQYTGLKPFRTYNGYRYHGGFSDHLPVLLELKFCHPEP